MTDTPLIVDVNIEAEAWQGAVPDLHAFVARTLKAALQAAKPSLDTAEVSVLLTDDAHQRVLNLTWRDQDKSTNVLSFPAGMDAPPPGQLVVLGDIALAFETVHREAQDQHINLEDHFCHLLVHGMLHVLAFDHETAAQADVMEPLEIKVLNELGISSPYPDRA